MSVVRNLARRLFAQIQPVTGTRAVGVVRLTAVAADVTIPRNTYLVPVVTSLDGFVSDLDHQNPIKVLVGPNDGPTPEVDSWTVTSGGTDVDVTSNVGGVRNNWPDETEFVLDPPVAGITARGVAQGAFTGGTDGAVLSTSFFEDLATAQQQADFFDGRLGNFPAVMLIWDRSEPVEGRTTGTFQGSSRTGRGRRWFVEQFGLYVVSSRLDKDPVRRAAGLDILDAIEERITDHNRNRDDEILCSAGEGVTITERSRLNRGPQAYVYTLILRASRTMQRLEERTFGPWEKTRYKHVKEAAGPLPETPLVDVTDDMP